MFNFLNKLFSNEEKTTHFETDKGMKATKVEKGFKSVVTYDLKGYREKVKKEYLEKQLNKEIKIPIEILNSTGKQELKVHFR